MKMEYIVQLNFCWISRPLCGKMKMEYIVQFN